MRLTWPEALPRHSGGGGLRREQAEVPRGVCGTRSARTAGGRRGPGAEAPDPPTRSSRPRPAFSLSILRFGESGVLKSCSGPPLCTQLQKAEVRVGEGHVTKTSQGWTLTARLAPQHSRHRGHPPGQPACQGSFFKRHTRHSVDLVAKCVTGPARRPERQIREQGCRETQGRAGLSELTADCDSAITHSLRAKPRRLQILLVKHPQKYL